MIVNGRYDLCCPPVSAYDLARRWPEATLRIVPDAGHSAAEPGVAREVLRALDEVTARVDSPAGEPGHQRPPLAGSAG